MVENPEELRVVQGWLDTEGTRVEILDASDAEWLVENGNFGARFEGRFFVVPVEALLLFERKRLDVRRVPPGVSWPPHPGNGEIAGAAGDAGVVGARRELLDQAPLEFPELIAAFARDDPRVWVKYCVYRDLRSRGYMVRQGFGGGILYRVYKRGAQAGASSAKYYVSVVTEEDPLALRTLDEITRRALADRRDLVLAVVDRLGEVTYYQADQYHL